MFRLDHLESVGRRGFIAGGVALGLIALKGASQFPGAISSGQPLNVDQGANQQGQES